MYKHIHCICTCTVYYVCGVVLWHLQDNQFLNLLISLLVDGEYTGKHCGLGKEAQSSQLCFVDNRELSVYI